MLHRIVVAFALAITVWIVAPTDARAEPELRLSGNGGGDALVLVVGAVIVSPVLSLASTTVNAVSWAEGRRPDWRWTMLGVGLGVISTLVGVALLQQGEGDTFGPGLALLGWGALSTTVGIGAAAQPRFRF